MGSIGVSTGSLVGRQVGDILDGRAVAVDKNGRRMGLPDFIRVYPNNSKESDKDGFILDMKGAPKAAKESFLNLWKGRSNTDVRNAQRSYDKGYRDAIKEGKSEAEAKKAGEIARTKTTMRAMQNILDRDKKGAGIYSDISLSNVKRRRRKTE